MFNWWDAGSGCCLLGSNEDIRLFMVSGSDKEGESTLAVVQKIFRGGLL